MKKFLLITGMVFFIVGCSNNSIKKDCKSLKNSKNSYDSLCNAIQPDKPSANVVSPFEDAKQRAKEGDRLHDVFCKDGYNVKVSISGEFNQNIKLTCSRFNSEWGRKFQKTYIYQELLIFGFENIELSNNKDYNFNYNIRYN